ncbi:MAG: metallophosphoesterase [Planctomycetia bacterium]|nr:metallophosphoesterase [Planctomycetia bacterium]
MSFDVDLNSTDKSSSKTSSLQRRHFLGVAGAMMAGAALGGVSIVPGNRVDAAETDTKGRKRTLRVAHLTDVHVEPELRADAGMAAALKHVQSLSDPPQVIFNGGDAVMETLGANTERAKVLWDTWHRVIKDCSIPVEHCVGNHDVWGWNKKGSGTTGNEPNWGKKRWLVEVGLEKSYRTVDRGSWRFLFLDSIHASPDVNFVAKLGDEQLHWLAEELKNTPATTNVAVVSHIPIVSVAVVEYQEQIRTHPAMDAGATHLDAQQIVRLFHKYPNVKLALSGHLHLTERLQYAGVNYICCGAVCGSWWKGPHHGTPEGYMLVDFYDDGSVENQYVAYGWKV